MNARNSNQQKYSNAAEQAGRVIGEFISIADDFSKRFESELSAKGRSCRSANTNDGSRNGARDDSGNVSGDGRGNDAKAYKNTSDSASYSNAGKDYRNKGFGDGRDASGFDKVDLESEKYDAGENPGEYVRDLREAAIYALDGFAKAKHRHDAARKIKSGEAGREKLSGDWSDDDWPEDWLDQMSALLKQNEPMEFFERLRAVFERGAEDSARDNTRDNSNYNAGDDRYTTDTVSGESSVIAEPGVDSSGVAHQRRQKLQNIFSDEQLKELNDSQFEELLSFVEINFKSALQLVRNK